MTKKLSFLIATLLLIAAPGAQQAGGSAGGQSGAAGAGQSGAAGAGQTGTTPGQSRSTPGTPGQGRAGAAQTDQERQLDPAGQTGIGTRPGQTTERRIPGSATTTPGQPGIPGQPGLGRPGSRREGASAAVNQQQITQLQTAFSQLGQGEQGSEQLTRTLTLMAPAANTRHIRQFVQNSSRILSQANISPAVHQRLASGIAMIVSPNVGQAQLQTHLTQLQQTLTTAGIPANDTRTLIRDLRMLAAQDQRSLQPRGSAPGSERLQQSRTPGAITGQPGQSTQRPGQPGTEPPAGSQPRPQTQP